MSRIDLALVSDEQRAAVVKELAVRMRPKDGSFAASDLAGIIDSDAVIGKAVRNGVDGQTLHGVLLTWTGYIEPQFLPISKALWGAVDLPAEG